MQSYIYSALSGLSLCVYLLRRALPYADIFRPFRGYLRFDNEQKLNGNDKVIALGFWTKLLQSFNYTSRPLYPTFISLLIGKI